MGANVSAELKKALDAEAAKPEDASDFNNASPADIVAEVRRLRTLLHTYTVSHPETKGLEVVWMMLSDGQLCIDVDTLCSANEKMTGESISEEKAKAKLKELNIAENAIDFDAFVKFFATEKKEGVGLTFQDIAGGKSEIGPSDLKRALSVEPLSPIFASDELDDKAAAEIIKVASPTGKVTPAEFGALQEQLNKRKLVVEAFKVWDTNGDGQVDLRDIIKTLQSHGEDINMEEARQILKEADIDEDGVIGFKDFASAIYQPEFEEIPASN